MTGITFYKKKKKLVPVSTCNESLRSSTPPQHFSYSSLLIFFFFFENINQREMRWILSGGPFFLSFSVAWLGEKKETSRMDGLGAWRTRFNSHLLGFMGLDTSLEEFFFRCCLCLCFHFGCLVFIIRAQSKYRDIQLAGGHLFHLLPFHSF